MFFYDESLLITHPEIAAEWSEKNYPLKPSDVTAGCHERVWWKGKCGHEWKTGIGNRTFRNTGCPYCTTRAVLKGFNDFATLHPEFLSEWSDKNGDVKPDQFREYSNKKVWWKCKNGHEWQASPHNRMKGKGCPFCSGRNTIIGENDLTIVYPSIIKEWDYEKNKPLRPEQFKAGSNTKVWWKCSKCGYEWRTTITSRTSGNSCPKCGPAIRGLAKRKDRVVFEKELKAINPTITIVGNYTVSTQKVKCSCNTCGNIWEALPGNLLKGKGCPTCARLKRNRKNSI